MVDIKRSFEILELDINASSEKIKETYRDLANVWHPDRFSNNSRLQHKAEKKIKELNEAYEKALAYSYLKAEHQQPMSGSGGKSGASLYTSRSRFHDPNLKKTFRQPTLSEEDLAALRKRAWRRCLSRTIDYLLMGLFLLILNVNVFTSGLGIPILLFPLLMTFLWMFIEAGLLGYIGTTPGKWLLGIKVTDRFHLKPGFPSALKRSLSVWCNGIGIGIPFIAPITVIKAYFYLKKERISSWDRDSGFHVVHEKVPKSRMFYAALSCTVIPLLCLYQIHTQTGLPIQDKRSLENMKAGQKKQNHVFQGTVEPKQHIQPAPANVEELSELGNTHAEQGRYTEAVECFKQAVKLRPDDLNAHFKLGSLLVKLGKHSDAAESFKQTVRIKPDFADGHFGLGNAWVELGRYSKAVEPYSRTIQIRPDFTEGHLKLGTVFTELGRYTEAIALYQQALQMKPESAGCYYQLGISHAKLRHHEEAITFLKQAIIHKPDFADAHHMLGLIYLAVGNRVAALEQYDLVKGLDRDLAEELLVYIEGMPPPDEY